MRRNVTSVPTRAGEDASPTRPGPLGVAAVVVGGSLAAWAVSIARMRGMDAGPGSDLGGLAWFLGIWVTMMAAMMLPSVAPMVLVFARVSQQRFRRGRAASIATGTFVAGYLAAWAAFGLAAYAVFRLVSALDLRVLEWDGGGPYVAGGAIAAAGLYELTPVKDVCLRHCRTPLHFVFHGWRDGRLGAVRMGAEHGAYCVGCCWGLMVALFALGVMSLFWMAVVAGVVFVEKATRYGARLSRVFAVALVVLGVWVAAAPGSVPGLTEPGSDGPMKMEPMSR